VDSFFFSPATSEVTLLSCGHFRQSLVVAGKFPAR
jgi:hypothetical protein